MMLRAGVLFVITLCALWAAERPNIVLIYADDLGYGDPGCYGSTAIPTPHIDAVAKNGVRFTSGYATSATCTPSRYALLTGQYPWRAKGVHILPGNAPALIKAGYATMPAMLQLSGYRTAVVGKWHLGLGDGDVNWNKAIPTDCPIDIGFSTSFIMAATGDRVPCVYVRDRLVVGLDPADPIEVSYGKPIAGQPTGKDNPELLRMHPSHGHDQSIVNGISRIGYMKGGKSALWTDENMADDFTGEAVRFIEQSKDKPFFLFFALHDPHVPRVPHPRFVGKSQLGPRGDAIVQADWCVGQITETLARLGLDKNTLIIISSDNGPVLDDGYKDDAKEKNGDHTSAGPLRGGKYSRYEGGTRVPFITSWPGRINPSVSDAIVSQVDLYASLAALVGGTLAEADAPDSINVLPALLGTSQTGRDHVIEEARGLSIRVGNWKYLPAVKGEKVNKNTNTELGATDAGVLYDLSKDPGEMTNVAAKYVDKAAELKQKLETLQAAGRSR